MQDSWLQWTNYGSIAVNASFHFFSFFLKIIPTIMGYIRRVKIIDGRLTFSVRSSLELLEIVE